jgi:hypothetical protein
MVVAMPVRADPVRTIPITSASLTINRSDDSDPIHLEGPRGFTLDATNENFNDFPKLCDGALNSCLPGSEVLVDAGSGDAPVAFTLDGQSYVTSPTSPFSAGVAITGSFVVPSFTGTEAVSVFTPFTFFGSALFSDGGGVRFNGSGTVRVDLAQTPDLGPGWFFQRAVYEFQPQVATPEPASIALLGSGLAACLMGRRRRSNS